MSWSSSSHMEWKCAMTSVATVATCCTPEKIFNIDAEILKAKASSSEASETTVMLLLF